MSEFSYEDKKRHQDNKYKELVKFVRKISKQGCELSGDCLACDALSLLRKIGEDE